MKNIRLYAASKYSSPEYEEIEPGIYKKADPSGLELDPVTDPDEAEKIRLLLGWQQCKDSELEKYLCIDHDGQKYYKRIGDKSGCIYRWDEEDVQYVTSLVFEQEPEFGENAPDSPYVSQYPLEDILDDFMCRCGDFYDKENEEDKLSSYVEFVCDGIEPIRDILTVRK